MTLHRLIYVSRPFGFDTAILGGILLGARRNNRRDGLTGALICRADIYLQLLEGPVPAVEAAFGRIVADDRHCDIERLTSGPVADRLFPAWEMLDDPARSWLWSAAEVAQGMVSAAAPAILGAVFARVAAERKLTQVAANEAGLAPAAATCPAGALV